MPDFPVLVYKPTLLHDNILRVVDDSSGGIKFTELITTLVSDFRHNLSEKDIEELPSIVEKLIRDSHDLKILDYTWTGMDRAKMFVYTE